MTTPQEEQVTRETTTRFIRWLRYRLRLLTDLLDGHPRHEPLIVRLMIGGRDPIAHRYANEYALIPHLSLSKEEQVCPDPFHNPAPALTERTEQ